MEKKDIITFFDNCAPWWDEDMVRNEDLITTILDNGGIQEGIHVLDVACGTGVLFPDYLNRNVASVTGIDISPEMAKIAKNKFPGVKVICGDVETVEFSKKFDAIMVYNAFPHFPDPAHLIKVLAGLVKPGGKLSIAHGMSREKLTSHHAGRASKVSIDLELYATYIRGFLSACPELTEDELMSLPWGARTMTLECGLRFLTDYLDGDKYFAVHRPGHNLDRCRTQLKMVQEMEAKWDDMLRILGEEKEKLNRK